MRKPIVADQFYPGNKAELNALLKSYSIKSGKAIAAICPHAGYVFSGKCASLSYFHLKKASTYIILGTDHSGCGTCLSTDDWETPFGIIKSNREICKRLIDLGIEEDNYSHKFEHSIEVQLPFIQFINPNATIVPIIINDINVAEKIKKVIDKDTVVIASSDFTHYGANYDYLPFTKKIKENLYKLDNDAIKFILDLDSKGFVDYVKETKATICGYKPIACLIEIMKGKAKPKLINYCSSGDVTKDYSNAVGYASIVFEE